MLLLNINQSILYLNIFVTNNTIIQQSSFYMVHKTNINNASFLQNWLKEKTQKLLEGTLWGKIYDLAFHQKNLLLYAKPTKYL